MWQYPIEADEAGWAGESERATNKFSLASACPYANEWRLAAARLATRSSGLTRRRCANQGANPPETPYIPRAECAKRAMTRIAYITAPIRRSPAKVKHASPFGKGGLGDRRLFRLSPKRLNHFANSELDSDSCLWISVTGRRSPVLQKNLFFIFRGQSSEQFCDDIA
jgi:hypothetical protein